MPNACRRTARCATAAAWRALATRRAARLAGIAALLLSFGAVGQAPQAGPFAPPPAAEPGAAQPRLLDAAGLRQPRVRARAAMIYNPATGDVWWESNGFEQRPIASITKVMTALVFLKQRSYLDLDRDVVMARSDVRRASTTYLRRGEVVSLYDLLHLALVASDNAAARALARVSPGGTAGFVQRMNAAAAELGLHDTAFADPTGLHAGNVSTAYDLSRLIAHATRRPVVSTIMRKTLHRMRTSRRGLTVRNTNRLLGGRLLVHGGKTGYIDASGYCLAAVVKLPGHEPLSLVVLGTGSGDRRFTAVRRLATWAARNGDALAGAGGRLAD